MAISLSSSTFKSTATGRRTLKSTVPDWNTASGQVANIFTTKSYSISLSASNSLYYALESGTLPPGLSLNTSNGQITGTFTSGALSDYTTDYAYNFSVRAIGLSGSSVREFYINSNSIYVGRTCATAGEGGTASATVPSGYVIKRIDFVSYGTPNGSCGSYTVGGCHAGYNLNSAIGSTSFSLGANNAIFGDPCGGTPKRLYIQVSHGPA